jgi:hypothetical protein
MLIPLIERELDYGTRQIAGLDYLTYPKEKLEIVVTSKKSELKPFKGDLVELYLTKDPLVVDLSRRAKIYAKVTKQATSLKDPFLVRKYVAELLLAKLIADKKVKQRPTYVTLVSTPKGTIQTNTLIVDSLYP